MPPSVQIVKVLATEAYLADRDSVVKPLLQVFEKIPGVLA